MADLRSLQWPLVLGLASLALVRPLVNIVADQLGTKPPPVVPIGITLATTIVWVAVVGLSRVAQPVLTLVAAGVGYGVLSIVLSAILSPILTGELQGPLAMPIAIVPVLVFNAAWGAVAGALALLVRRTRSPADRTSRR